MSGAMGAADGEISALAAAGNLLSLTAAAAAAAADSGDMRMAADTRLQGRALVGDIGGTNARLALCHLEDGSLSEIEVHSAREAPRLQDCIRRFLDEHAAGVDYACLAVACPVTSDQVQFTNCPWEFSIARLQQELGLRRLIVINDFTAQSMSIPGMDPAALVQVGGGQSVPGAPIAVYGAGTGLGVAHLICHDGTWLPLPGEGGHMDLSPGSMLEDLVLITLRARIGHVSAERVLSGPGLVNLYEAIAMRSGRLQEHLTPADVTRQALEQPGDGDCREALMTFCTLMGRFGGNLALLMGTFGGVYITGGIVPRFLQFFEHSPFRQAFEDKGRFRGYLERIPTYVVTDTRAGLRGAGAMLRQELGAVLVQPAACP